jgi:hypothetical protein
MLIQTGCLRAGTDSVPDTPIEKSLSAIARYRDAGKIQHVGLSEVGVEDIERGRQGTVLIRTTRPRCSRARRARRSSGDGGLSLRPSPADCYAGGAEQFEMCPRCLFAQEALGFARPMPR